MTLSIGEKRLRHGLYTALRWHERPVSLDKLVTSHVDASVWKELASRGFIEQLDDQKMQLSESGLALAKRWFPSRAGEFEQLHRIDEAEDSPDIRANYDDWLQ